LLSQACGYDLLYDSRHCLVPLATPCYRAAGCQGARYRSFVVVRQDHPARALADLRGSRCVVNEASSHSGNNALRALVAPLAVGGRFFASVALSGAHTDSLRGLRRGDFDVACIDSVVLDLLAHCRPHAIAGLRVLAQSALALAPPYVTSVHTDAATRARLRQALLAALRDPELRPVRERLLIDGLEFVSATRYRELAAFEQIAQAHGYFELPAPALSPLHRLGQPDHALGAVPGRRAAAE
jgi:ABC-type phosphate/phosphonate transport system substrate-binding protein